MLKFWHTDALTHGHVYAPRSLHSVLNGLPKVWHFDAANWRTPVSLAVLSRCSRRYTTDWDNGVGECYEGRSTSSCTKRFGRADRCCHQLGIQRGRTRNNCKTVPAKKETLRWVRARTGSRPWLQHRCRKMSLTWNHFAAVRVTALWLGFEMRTDPLGSFTIHVASNETWFDHALFSICHSTRTAGHGHVRSSCRQRFRSRICDTFDNIALASCLKTVMFICYFTCSSSFCISRCSISFFVH